MGTDRRIIITPGLSQKTLEETWIAANDYAKINPGATVTLLFPPGEYPLPEAGVIVFNERQTVLYSEPPGTEVSFRHNRKTGKTEVTHRRIA